MKYDEYGNLLSYENPAAGISYSYEYEHKFYRPVKYTDPRGNVKTWTYYEDTPLVKEITDALGRKQTMLEYTPQGQPKKVQGADGSINEIIYDETTGNMIGSKDPLLRTESSTLDDAGNVLSTTDKLGRTIQRFTYDVMGRQTRAVDANGYFVNYYYDKRGLLTETIDSENRGTDTILESK